MSSYKPKQSTSDRAGWIKRFGLQVVEGREAFDAREDRGLTWFFKVCTGQKMSENSALVRQIFKGLFLYKRGVRNALNLLVEEHEWALPHLQAPCSLLHLSDLHFLPGHPLAKAVVEKLDDVKADACVITGDYRFPLEGEIETAMEGMRAIREALPETSICILGNHDSLDMVARLEALGYTVLVNESMALRPDLHVVGVDDPTSYRTDDLPKALAGVSDNVARILLSHTCENFVEAAEAGFDLHLSGHTHGGQVCLPGGRPLIHNLPVPRHMNAGRWAHESMQGYTHRGTGTCSAEVRFHCPPEIALHNLIPCVPATQ